jgi:hypothetical protein
MGDFSKDAYLGHREMYPECYPPAQPEPSNGGWVAGITVALLVVGGVITILIRFRI